MLKLTPLRWFIVLSLIAIALALGLPPDPHALHQLHASSAAYRLALVVLLIPYVMVWYAAFYAYAKLQEYSASLQGSRDGEGFRKISFGMGVLAFSLVVPTIIVLILGSIAVHNPGFKPASEIIGNYVGIYPGMIAFLLLLNGASGLLRTTKEGPQKLDPRWHAIWFLLLSVLFSHLVIENHYSSHPYHLPLAVLIVTFILPYLYGWMVGLLCGYELYTYSRTVKGMLYRKGIRQFADGILVTIFGSIAIQFVSVTLMKRVDSSLGLVALTEYILISIVAVGLIRIALGTKKLKSIEEV